MDVVGEVWNGPISQYGWIDQVCISLAFLYTISNPLPSLVYGYCRHPQKRHTALHFHGQYCHLLQATWSHTRSEQIAPTLHPPFNITSNSMSTINWTVSLVSPNLCMTPSRI